MNKNEYRRALIMLRPAEKGFAGHVRLERRVMMGTMDFIVTAPRDGDRLEAALAGQRDGEAYAAALGTLRRDRRGQAALAWSFDPRKIDGRPLEAYSLALVARAGGDGCRVVLSGNVDGARPVDMAKVEAAVCALFREEGEPAADLPEAGETAKEEADMAIAINGDGWTGGALTPAEAAAETRIFTRSRPAREAEGAPGQPAEAPAQKISEEAAPDGEPAAAEGDMGFAPDAADGTGTAAEALGIDAAQGWTGALEPLRALFAGAPPVATLEDDFVYVSAPLAGVEGEPGACRIGLHVSDGRVDAVRYAVPALYTAEPPAGLEDWTWVGDDTHGYWVRTADPLTGEGMG